MVSDEIMLKVENVSKVYRLGEIGGTTLRDELQRLKAKIRHKEDPTKKIGAKNYNKGEKFKALDNISFEVKKGERIGIIGHNGAGKSTLLKLISRVTGPTEGNIYLNGRVASMLEVGTGFHAELTGRENVYMNGAILGMTKKEIDAKMEDIIQFSEVRQFIDTPVKRYSSGMYVKLAFSVAAHLDSEIMIMDEVLAVGDMAFQNKCLTKMREVSEQDNRTILYVSHNMNTIRQLCDKVIVLDNGQIIFVGDVEKGIELYINKKTNTSSVYNSLEAIKRPTFFKQQLLMKKIELIHCENNIFIRGNKIPILLLFSSIYPLKDVRIRISIISTTEITAGTIFSKSFSISKEGMHSLSFNLDTSLLTEDTYFINISLLQKDNSNNLIVLDLVTEAIYFKIINNDSFDDFIVGWSNRFWSNIHFPSPYDAVLDDERIQL